MANIFVKFVTMLMCLASARGTNSKFVKTVPTITNSLVNLGKMDISFYFNGKHQEDQKPDLPFLPNLSVLRSHAMDGPCPCSAFKGTKDPFLPNPSDLIYKILRSNDLFKEPTSNHCCDSHEQIQESTVFFEVNPRRPMTINNLKNPINQMRLPFPIRFPSPSGLLPTKPKAMEIFLFPKRKDIASMDFTKAPAKTVSEDDIQVVGDKKIKPFNEGASVKKDLTSFVEKKNSVLDDNELKVEEIVTNVNNAL